MLVGPIGLMLLRLDRAMTLKELAVKHPPLTATEIDCLRDWYLSIPRGAEETDQDAKARLQIIRRMEVRLRPAVQFQEAFYDDDKDTFTRA